MFSVDLSVKGNYVSYTHPGGLSNVVCVQFSDVPFTSVLGRQEHFVNRKPQTDALNVWTELDTVSYMTGIEVAVRAI